MNNQPSLSYEPKSDFIEPYAVQLAPGSALAKFILKLLGWSVDFYGLPTRQGVIAVYPHTSNWDFVVGILAKWSLGLQVKFWAKDSLFSVPVLGPWMRWLGGVPVNRKAPQGLVGQAVESLHAGQVNNDFYWLVVAPEGTRKRTEGWRSGFYSAAHQAGVPLAIARLDFGRKKITLHDFFQLTGNSSHDMQRVADLLEGTQGAIHSNASPICIASRRNTQEPSSNLSS